MEENIGAFNIYLCGVGGQGIGLLTEILLRSSDYAGQRAKAVDTHGLAQRGGVVVSHLRIGEQIRSPMVSARRADLVIGLERHEALRGADYALRNHGVLIYYDTVIQPLGVRLGSDRAVSQATVEQHCSERDITVHRILGDSVSDSRMQNIVVLAHIFKKNLVPLLRKEHFLKAMEDLMEGAMLEKNVALFHSI